MPWNLGPQALNWTSPSRKFATFEDLVNSQPNYEHEIAVVEATKVKYQGIAPVVGGWALATGAPLPGLPPVAPVPLNDSFTKMMLMFDGIEGSTTYRDVNAADWPRKWTTHGQAGFGNITNVGELFYPSALRLDGKTVVTAPDERRFDFENGDLTIRGYFLCDFPLGEERVLAAKSSQDGRWTYRIVRTAAGHINIMVGTFSPLLVDRQGSNIVDRNGEQILTRLETQGVTTNFDLEGTTVYSDTVNTGWHQFMFTRQSDVLDLELDGVSQDTDDVTGVDFMRYYTGPFTIAGDGPPLDGAYQGLPWIGGLNQFAIDIGVAR